MYTIPCIYGRTSSVPILYEGTISLPLSIVNYRHTLSLYPPPHNLRSLAPAFQTSFFPSSRWWIIKYRRAITAVRVSHTQMKSAGWGTVLHSLELYFVSCSALIWMLLSLLCFRGKRKKLALGINKKYHTYMPHQCVFISSLGLQNYRNY